MAALAFSQQDSSGSLVTASVKSPQESRDLILTTLMIEVAVRADMRNFVLLPSAGPVEPSPGLLVASPGLVASSPDFIAREPDPPVVPSQDLHVQIAGSWSPPTNEKKHLITSRSPRFRAERLEGTRQDS